LINASPIHINETKVVSILFVNDLNELKLSMISMFIWYLLPNVF